MTNFKGTKGNWYTQFNGFYHEIRVEFEDKRLQAISFLYDVSTNPPTDITISKENEANVLLMSKAPEMLEMLSRVIETFTPTVDSPLEQYQEDLLSNIEQLIKEATKNDLGN